MPSLQLHIVGFPYRKDIAGHVSEFLAEAPGRDMTVRVQRDNEADTLAVRAFDWQGRHVGFVSKDDLPQAWGALQASGRKSLRGRIVSTDIEHPCAIFECFVPEGYAPVAELYPQQPFLEWHYNGPVLDYPEELDALDYMMDEIDDRLSEQQEWDGDDLGNFQLLMQRFLRNSLFDISGEMDAYRRRLITRCRQTGMAELEALADELSMAGGRTGRETSGGCVLEYWMGVIAAEPMSSPLLVRQHLYDVEAIEAELKQFPDEMYYEWQHNRSHFVSKLYYKHIPREVLWQFVSGIAFVEMKKGMAAQAEKAEVDKKPINVIMTGEHAKYIENSKA